MLFLECVIEIDRSVKVLFLVRYYTVDCVIKILGFV